MKASPEGRLKDTAPPPAGESAQVPVPEPTKLEAVSTEPLPADRDSCRTLWLPASARYRVPLACSKA